MHRIGILSDTHGLLRQEVLEALKGCEMIFHGGDINKQEILDQLTEIAPVTVVRGNNDKDWAEHIPVTAAGEIYGIQYFMVHNKKQIPKDLSGISLVIYGHSHNIMKEISSGKTVKQIAKKHHISEELSEQINRMYLTHPGIDVDGILRRLGI